MTRDPDECLLELDIEMLDNGDVLLRQGVIDHYDISVILHPCHLDLLASLTGFVRIAEVGRATERFQDRINLLAALIDAHTKPGDPLRAAAAVLAGARQPEQLHGTTKLVDGRADGVLLPAQPHLDDLFHDHHTEKEKP